MLDDEHLGTQHAFLCWTSISLHDFGHIAIDRTAEWSSTGGVGTAHKTASGFWDT